jgi:hypothetical protein
MHQQLDELSKGGALEKYAETNPFIYSNKCVSQMRPSKLFKLGENSAMTCTTRKRSNLGGDHRRSSISRMLSDHDDDYMKK